MATTYTNEPKEIVFLNNKNIAQKQADLDTISYNAIPSLSLFNSTYSELTGKSNDIEISAYGISCQVNAICGQISNEIKFQAEKAKSYTEQLSTEFETISGDLRGAVTVYDNGNGPSHELSVRKLSNAEYNELIVNDATKWNELYIINDDHRDLRGQRVKNLGEPFDSTDAATKAYVDGEIDVLSGNLINEFTEYSNATSAESLAEAKTYGNETFAKYDGFNFNYNFGQHQLELTIPNNAGQSTTLSVDATDFIKNGIIERIDVNGEYLIITWKRSDGSEDTTRIPLDQLINLYTTPTTGGGIDIVPVTSNGFMISCNNTIARISQLDDYQLTSELDTNVENCGYIKPDYVTTQLDTLSDYYISKQTTTITSPGVVTEYLKDVSDNGGIVIRSNNIDLANSTSYKYTGIVCTRTGQNPKYFDFINDEDGDGIVRFKDLATADYVPKSIIRSALNSINDNSSFSDVITALLNLKAAVQTT